MSHRKKRVILDLISLLLLLAGIFLGIRILTNESFLKAEKRGEDAGKGETRLLKMNIPSGYVPYYNLGNSAYKKGNYDAAIGDYKKALGYSMPRDRECPIRVNLALAMIHKIDFASLNSEKDINGAIMQLQAARNILTKKGCADPEGTNGHNPEAEQLKEDIDKMIEELQQKNQSSGSDSQNQEQKSSDSGQGKNQKQQDSGKKKQSGEEKRLQDELENQQREAAEERSKSQDQQAEEQQREGQAEEEQGIPGSSPFGASPSEPSQRKNW